MSLRTCPDGGETSTDELFAAFRDARRRQILFCLREQRRPMTVAELGGAVIEREGGSLDDGVDLDDHPVTASLHHVHLPRLRDAGLVRWTDDGTVAYDGSLEAVESLFDLLEKFDFSDPALS